MNRRPWFQSSFDGPSLILQQHEGVPLEQSIKSLKKSTKKGEGEGCTDVGGGLLTALTAVRDEVSQSRKWLDLPCGRLAHPDNNPHSFEHPGSPQAPTEGDGATAEWQKRENLLVQVAKTWNLDGAVTPLQNKTQVRARLWPFKGLWV